MLTEERILGAVDHPFLARLYGTIQTDTHLHFLMQVCACCCCLFGWQQQLPCLFFGWHQEVDGCSFDTAPEALFRLRCILHPLLSPFEKLNSRQPVLRSSAGAASCMAC